MPRSVAVVPFENLSPDPDDAFFAVGMQDEIVSQLTKIGLRVFPIRGLNAQGSIADAGRDLNVRAVLGGSVHYAKERVRVNAHLSDPASGESLWSDSYDRELDDIFAVQSAIALDVADALRVELSDAERQRVERMPTTDRRARDLYLRARARNPNNEEVLRALTELEEALEIDPDFSAALVLYSLAQNYAAIVDPQRDRRMRHLARL